jgi:hypothetical protein
MGRRPLHHPLSPAATLLQSHTLCSLRAAPSGSCLAGLLQPKISAVCANSVSCAVRVYVCMYRAVPRAFRRRHFADACIDIHCLPGMCLCCPRRRHAFACLARHAADPCGKEGAIRVSASNPVRLDGDGALAEPISAIEGGLLNCRSTGRWPALVGALVRSPVRSWLRWAAGVVAVARPCCGAGSSLAPFLGALG